MAFPFGSRTVGVLVDAIAQAYSHADMGTLFLQAEADRWEPREPSNKQVRLQGLFAAMRTHGGSDAEKSALELVRLLLVRGAPTSSWGSPAGWWNRVIDALAADGWDYDEESQRLVPSIPGIKVLEETAQLELELADRGWGTAAGHYRQALDAFTAGNWSSANAQLRSLLEELLPSAAEELTGSRPKQVRAAIDVLRSQGALVEGEFSLLKGLWDLSQPRGSHAGLSDEEEARFRLMTVTAYGRFLLARLG